MCSNVISCCLFLLFIRESFNLNAPLSSETLDGLKKPNPLANIKISNNNLSKSSNAANETKFSSSSVKGRKNTKRPELIYDEDDDYDDDEGDDESGYENEVGNGRNTTRRRRIFIIKRIGTTFAWGRWQKWSRCSNSCVQIRKRQCIKRIQNATDAEALEIPFYPNLADQTTGCFGIMKKYRLCKDDKCKFTNRQMRDEQCSMYNRQVFKGKFYNWQGYEKEHTECELYCKPIDSDIFISMNQSVTDGTSCEKPAIYYTHYYRRKAVCVEGICKVFI